MALYKHDSIYFGYSDCRVRKYVDENHEVFVVDNNWNGSVDFVFSSQNLCNALNIKDKERNKKHNECQQLIWTVWDKLKDKNFDTNYIHEDDATTIWIPVKSGKEANKVVEVMNEIMDEL